MTRVYLSRMEFENFRTFGTFGINVPPGPGLTLIVGTNGLGKSSFFDGLEWCLTGAIRRFSDHLTKAIKEKDYLTRRDAKENSHRVSVQFGGGGTFTRTATESPRPEEILRLLKRKQWGRIEDIATYLAFTHFLGQAAQQRFTSRDRGEQWESLKGPSGIDRLEEVRASLRGASTRNAFRKRLDEEQRGIDSLAEQLAAWQDTTARLAHLRQVADAAGDYSGPSLVAKLSELRERLLSVSGRDHLHSGPASEQIVALRHALSDEVSHVQQRRDILAPFDALVRRHIELTIASDRDGTSTQAARSALDAARQALSQAEVTRTRIQSQLEEESARLSQREATFARLQTFRAAHQQIAALQERLSAIETDEQSLVDELADRREKLAAAENLLARQGERQTELTGLVTVANAAKVLLERAGHLAQLEVDYAAKVEISTGAAAAAVNARANVSALSVEESRLRSEIIEGARLVAEAQRRTSEITAAVAKIASHLSEHDVSCPVCTTPFDRGILKRLAENAASDRDSVLAPLEAAQADRRTRAAQIASELGVYRMLLEAADAAASAVSAAEHRAREARQTLAAELGVETSADLASVASRRHGEAVTAIANLNATIAAGTSDAATAEATRVMMQSDVQRILLEIAGLRQYRAEIETALHRQRDLLSAGGEDGASVWATEDAIDACNATIATTRDNKARVQSELAGALSNETAERDRQASAEAKLRAASAAIDAALKDRQALERRWSEVGLPGVPVGSVLDEERGALSQKAAELETMLANLDVLATANEAIERHKDIADLVHWMDERGGERASDQPELHEQELQRLHQDAIEARELTKSAQEAVNAYTERLKKEAEEFSTQFLVPLNDLIDGYNQALLSTPGESIRFNAAHNVDRTRFDMGLRYRDQLDEALYNTELPPQIILSEGQMAANGFSILCAASTAYPWSNWRALLLDDPLQHNDIIHAAAFVDVMRNLVQIQGYQLIMSSHDRTEGEFFARKFEAANLPCTVVALTAPSKGGVKYDSPRYNSAARALLSEELAKRA